MIDNTDPLSIIIWCVFFLAAGMYPLGIMLGAPCSPCCSGPYCLMYRFQGWSGAAVDAPQPLGTDGTFDKYYSTQTTYTVSGNAGTPTGVLNYTATLNLSANSIQATINGTYTVYTGHWTGGSPPVVMPFTVTLERSGEYDIASGDTYVLSDVVSSSISSNVDEYGRKCIDLIGTLSVRLATGVNRFCVCNCEPWFYGDFAAVRPETYSLTFTDTRSPDPMLGELNQYSGFMPPNPYRGGSGCFNFLTRLLSPIVMRKASTALYISDPIPYSPCRQVVYQFNACTGQLSVALKTNIGNEESGRKFSYSLPACLWSQADYSADPPTYSADVNSHVYNYGFATVSPGGTYAPEAVVSCGGLPDANMFLSEGCDGKECPKDIRLTVNVSGFTGGSHLLFTNNEFAGGFSTFYSYTNSYADRTGLNGDYVLSYTNPTCQYVDSNKRGYYQGTFALPSGGTVVATVLRGQYTPGTPGCPGCTTIETKMTLQWSGVPYPSVITGRKSIQGAYPDPANVDQSFIPGTRSYELTTDIDPMGGFVASGSFSASLCSPMCGAGTSGTESVSAIEKYQSGYWSSFVPQAGLITWTLT